ncbi:dimethylsulfonioproprionate lyase family protein [Shimia abyssi]|uniref:Dimethylsulfoniopropionate lyase DddQ n=1 Tax=Shimia abyssi TaxID=1662395 RepID=A0A2P8FJY1_9RHOB|nr:dimethylsulfonioproprionate lyase family protein [Shimia abyssi]PSL22032.1 dimethylsulfoniopropionate lyase DddQ [Shimia abyssi]
MNALTSVLNAARALHASHSKLHAFAPWPDDLTPANLPSRPLPASDLVANTHLTGVDMTQPLIDAVRATAGFANWKHTYREDEVGADFLARYGYYELFGPTGHFRTTKLRGYIAYWGSGLHYDWHSHEAEEIYLCLSGNARFLCRNNGTEHMADLSPGDTRAHTSWQTHAMTTAHQPILTFVLWRGTGLAGLPLMAT